MRPAQTRPQHGGSRAFNQVYFGGRGLSTAKLGFDWQPEGERLEAVAEHVGRGCVGMLLQVQDVLQSPG